MRIDEILGFARTSAKKHTVKRRPPEKDDDSVAVKLKARRAAAAKGDKDAYTHNFKKASN